MNLYALHSNPRKLKQYALAQEVVPDLFWEKYNDDLVELRKREDLIAKSPQHAYLYAERVLKGPFPKGEDAIASYPVYAFWYAYDVILCPFPKGETSIAKIPKYAFWYASYILRRRFPEGEDGILKSRWAQDYRQEFL